MNKKIFFISIVLIAFAMSVSAVCAVNVDINNPDGYQINDQLGVKNQKAQFMGMDAIQTIIVMEKGNENITVTIFEVDHGMDLSASGGSEMKTINKTEGVYQEKDGRSIFLYKSNDQFIQIEAPNEQLIEQVVM